MRGAVKNEVRALKIAALPAFLGRAPIIRNNIRAHSALCNTEIEQGKYCQPTPPNDFAVKSAT